MPRCVTALVRPPVMSSARQVFDYDYAPSSEMIHTRRIYFNTSQEGRNDIDVLRSDNCCTHLQLIMALQRARLVQCFEALIQGAPVCHCLSDLVQGAKAARVPFDRRSAGCRFFHFCSKHGVGISQCSFRLRSHMIRLSGKG